MSLKIRIDDHLICAFCKSPYHPPPQVKRPVTCGRPECLKERRRTLREGRVITPFPRDGYKLMLEVLLNRGLEKEWMLVYILGETGMLVSEVLRIKPVDLYFDGPEKKILVHQSSPKPAWSPKVFQKVSGSVAGAIEGWVKRSGVPRFGRILPVSKRGAQKMFERAVRMAGVQGRWGTRSLRHMFGMIVARATDSIPAVARALRMKGPHPARIYVTMTRELMEKGA